MFSFDRFLRPILLVLLISTQSANISIAQQKHSRRPQKSAAPAKSASCTLSEQLLTSTQWRIYMSSLQIPRKGGLPIRLLADGKVVSDDISWLQYWQKETDGTITLREEDGKVVYKFQLDEERCVLAQLNCEAGAEIALLGPKGTDFLAYIKQRCPERNRKNSE